MKSFFFKFYGSLGNTKTQRFVRFMLILIIIAAVICYGFHSGNLHIGSDVPVMP